MTHLFQTACLLGLAFLTSLPLRATDTETLSPDQSIRATLSCPADGPTGFSVNYQDKEVFRHINLGLQTDRRAWEKGLTLRSASEATLHTDDYTLLSGKRLHCTNRANERTFRLENADGQVLSVILRVYDDGVAFRYALDGEEGEHLTGERTAYDIPEGRPRWMPRHLVGNEDFFPLNTDGQPAGAWGYPSLCEPTDGVYALLTESGLNRSHCGSYLDNSLRSDNYRIRLVDRSLPLTNDWLSPWRIAIIGTAATVVESTLVTDVADPCRLDDTSWVEPGVASWIYWAHNHGSRDCALLKEYVDLAADMGWPYTLIDAEWDSMSNGGTIETVADYAHSKGVKPLLWYNSSTNWVSHGAPGPFYRLNDRNKREQEFAWLEKEGFKGVKIDFFPDDSLSVINYYIDLLEDAARHHLTVNFHGGILPKGWQRTYPHLLTQEAVYGAEWYNNNAVLTDRAACHNATLPFTRNVIGPMDYTPGTFSDSQHPHITTHAHELALPLLFESGMQHMPDRPSVYRELPETVRRLLSTLPTVWNDTRLLAGTPGDHVVIARRKGKVWYIAGINGKDTAATLKFSLQRLSLGGSCTVCLITDEADGRHFHIEPSTPVSPDNVLHTDCLPRGGFVLILTEGRDN